MERKDPARLGSHNSFGTLIPLPAWTTLNILDQHVCYIHEGAAIGNRKRRLCKMGPKATSPHEMTESCRDQQAQTSHLNALYGAFPFCGQEAALPCKTGFATDLQSQDLVSIMLPARNQGSVKNNRPPRSQAIPIERRAKEVDDLLDENCEDCDPMYDLATWRMYNLIVDHREKYPVKASPNDASGFFLDTSNCETLRRYLVSVDERNRSLCEIPVNYQPDYFLEGEVFELEL
jgi:hypothetical protein